MTFKARLSHSRIFGDWFLHLNGTALLVGSGRMVFRSQHDKGRFRYSLPGIELDKSQREIKVGEDYV
jgi:hypothetical protein